MSCTEYGGSSRGFFCSNYISDEKLAFLDARYADIGQYESQRRMQIRHRRLLCGISFPDCEESADGKVTFPKPVCRIFCQNFGAACMEDLSKPGGEVN
jgi:hypothetical protein